MSAEPSGHVSIRGLIHDYGDLRVLDGVTAEVGDHEVIGIVGASGSGKTTLLELVCGLREQTAGSVSVGDATAVTGRLAMCAYMPQRDLLLPWLSAIDNAAIALRNSGMGGDAARELAAPLMGRLGLGGFANAHPGELSGGMRQRVAFLRTLLAGKPVLLLDEPFGALDAITRAEMQGWLRVALGEDPRTTLLVTHDVEEALYVCDRVLVLSPRPGKVVAEFATAGLSGEHRTAIVTDPAFVAVREQALEALGEPA